MSSESQESARNDKGETGQNAAARLLSRFPALRNLALIRRRRVPFVPQTAAADCGAACIAMVLAYHGKPIPLDDVRETAGATRLGLNAAVLLQTARHYGLRGRGVKLQRVEDLQYLPAGSVLHWRFRHFVVLEKVGRHWVDLVDPSIGRRRVPNSEVNHNFTGVALTFEPGEDFEPSDIHQQGAWRWVGKLMMQSGLIPQILTTTLIIQLLALAVPVLTGLLVDRVVPRGDNRLLAVLTAGVVALTGFQVLSALLRSYLLLHLRTRLDARMTLEFVDHLLELPYKFFQQRSTGDLLMRLGSTVMIREVMTTAGLSGVLDGLMVVLYLVALLVANWEIGLLVAALGVLRLALYFLTRRKQRDLMSESLETQAESRNYQVQMLEGIETVKACGAEVRSAEAWSKLFVKELNVSISRGRLDAVVNSLLQSLAMVSPLVVLLYGGMLVIDGDMTLGTMLALSALAAGFLTPLSTLVSSLIQLQVLGSYLDRVNEVMETPREQESQDRRRLPTVRGRFSMEQVTFTYSPLLPSVLKDFSIEVEPGQFVAIVGSSGSGKSTLASLMAGLYEPQKGVVRFDGVNIDELDLPWLRSHLGYVPQSPFLLGQSIRSNIALVDPELPLHRIVEAARQACIHDEILTLPMGYDTTLADRGASLAGGQRQRIALARALVHRPKILILDEATSALDAVTEERVQRNLGQLKSTRVVIAHRLSTIRHADVILVMDQGQIAERGTHEELLRIPSGKYAELVAAQMSDDEDDAPVEKAS